VIVIVSVWTPLTHTSIAARWFSLPNIIIFSPVPVLVVGATRAMPRMLKREAPASPFMPALLLLFLGYTGLAIGLWPNIIPRVVSIREVATPPESMGFTLVGARFVIPFILGYSAWSYYVFRGKVKVGESNAYSRNFDLNGEARTARARQSSPIVSPAEATPSHHQLG
jgi:cytochrome d ubiquinol oxidase subunit II